MRATTTAFSTQNGFNKGPTLTQASFFSAGGGLGGNVQEMDKE